MSAVVAPQIARTPVGVPPAPAGVRVNGLRRTFDGREVLAGVDVEVRSGEFVALLGRSGSGKSTLLRILAGLDDGATGDIHRPERRSVVFQDPRLLPWAKVIDNVVLGQRGDASRTAAREALHEVGLIGLEHAWPATLSGGEAQRVALARALIREPELLLLDEPFGALDALTRIKMHGLVRQLCERHRPAVLLVTHDVDEAIVLADRVLVLVDGAIAVDRDTHSHFGVEALGAARPRRHGSPEFAELRSDLLAHLGVTDL